MNALGFAALLLFSGPALAQPCASRETTAALRWRLEQGHDLDAHNLAQSLAVLCPGAPDGPTWALLDGLALLRLDEPVRAQQLWVQLRNDAPDRETREASAVLLAWSHLRGRDRDAFLVAMERVPSPARPRLITLAATLDESPNLQNTLRELPEDARAQAEAAAAAYQHARHLRRPAIAGAMSMVLPGAGQIYAGSWQAGAVAFILNGIFITATVQLVGERLWFPAAATGLGAGFFYLGNIINAADLARARSETAAQEPRRRLEVLLVPETRP